MRISKKIVSVVLAVLMAFTVMPMSVFAADTFTVEKIEVQDLEVAYRYTAPDVYDEYDERNADFVVSVDKAIEEGDVVIAGQYGEYDWTQITLPALDANEPYALLADAIGFPMTYADICNLVKVFECGVVSIKAGVTLNVALVIDGEVADVQKFAAAPTATFEKIDVAGLETAYKFVAPEEAEDAYADMPADFVVSFDQAIAADSVVLSGQYGEYDWTDVTLPALEANAEYALLANNGMGDVTYNDVCNLVKEFYCGVKTGVPGATMTVALKVGDMTVCSVDYKFITKDFEQSIETGDTVDLNVYAPVDANTQKVVVEYPDGTKETITKFTGDEVKVNFTSAPAEMDGEMTVAVYDKDGNKTGEATTSIVAYCEAIIDDATMTNEMKDLAKATINYGIDAANYFNVDGTLAEADKKVVTDATVDVNTLLDADHKASVIGLSINGVSFNAVATPELRFFVDITEEDAVALNEAGITCDEGYNARFVWVADAIALEVTGIPASKFGERITIFGDGFEVNYTPIQVAYSLSKSTDAKTSALGQTIINYCDAAANVF